MRAPGSVLGCWRAQRFRPPTGGLWLPGVLAEQTLTTEFDSGIALKWYLRLGSATVPPPDVSFNRAEGKAAGQLTPRAADNSRLIVLGYISFSSFFSPRGGERRGRLQDSM